MTQPSPQPSRHVVHYFLDDERQDTDDSTLTVAEILRRGGLDPQTHYLVELHGQKQEPHMDLAETIHIHEKARFISVFRGPTPVS